MAIQQSAVAPRLQVIDFIRGVALLGILVINIQTYTLYSFLSAKQVYTFGLDQPATYVPTQFLIQLLVHGQFYTMYSFLFGLGFYLMMEKNNRLGLASNRLFRRRLGVLLLIGLLHAYVFWFGDILHKYALLGFTLLYFYKKPVPTLGRWVVGLALYMVAFKVGKAVLFPVSPASLAADQQQMEALVLQIKHTWQAGSVWEVMSLQKLGVVFGYIRNVENGNFVHYEIMFLLGLIAGKTQLFSRVSELRPRLLKAARLLLLPALLLKGVSCLPILQPLATQSSYEPVLLSLAEFIGTPLLTLVYLAGLLLLSQGQSGRLFGWIANTGRLGLTNYLAQTLLCMGIFYGYAGGWAGHLTLLETCGCALLLYGLQVVYSNVWLRSHAQGPLEKLWRHLTYGPVNPALASPAARTATPLSS